MERRVLIPSQIKIDQKGILVHQAIGEKKVFGEKLPKALKSKIFLKEVKHQ